MFFPLPTSGEGNEKEGEFLAFFPLYSPPPPPIPVQQQRPPPPTRSKKKAFGVGAVTDVEQNGYKGEKEEEEEG